MLVALALTLLEVLMNQPPVAPPAPPSPQTPPQLSASTLESVRVELERRGVCAPSVRVSATDDTLGARRIVDAFTTDTGVVPLPPPLRGRRVWVLDGAAPGAPLDLIISGEPMSRGQLRALLDDRRYPEGLMAIAHLVTATDGAIASLGSSHDGNPQGFPKEIAERVRPPAVTGPPGQRRFAFDSLASLKTPHSRVTVEVDGEGGLDLHIEPLLPLDEPPPGLGATPSRDVVLPPPTPLPPAVAPPRLSEAALEAVRLELEGRGVCGPSVRVGRSEQWLGARHVVYALATDAMAVPDHQRFREVWVRGDSKPERPLDLIISGEPMSRAQLREILDDEKHPANLFDVAKLVTKTDGAIVSLGSTHDGDPQGFPKEIAERVRPPALTGPPGQRRFSFDTLGSLKAPHGRVTVEVDGKGGLDLHIEPLLPWADPPPGLGAPPPLNVVLPPATGDEPDAEDTSGPQFPGPPKPGSR